MNELSEQRLQTLIEEATVDAYGEDEQLTGFYTMIADHLALPFETTLLGVTVTVASVDLTGDQIIAWCTRGPHRQAIAILDLPLPTPAPDGAEWISAYQHWAT
ncbi:calcium-binding protein [Streptomyces hesseae]|uniref:Calcium-binding protein n=1 Tax=Streptomyces hesseae TaxID=3075519 RepID=A0ABU2SXC7_9ACTN|nr:calcium-binding protein [Streptomyces sp. DSM 40473]MDT0453657.1 calcium-binding protein [Streptomyces sp. DSM 40473]